MSVKISNYQVFILLFISSLSTTILGYPPKASGHDGWLSGILAAGYNLLLVGVIYIIFKRTSYKDIVEVLNQHMLIKLITLSLLLFYLVTLAALEVTYVRELSLLYLLPETPVVVVLITCMGLAVYAARHGLEVVARFGGFVFPLIGILALLTIWLLLPDIDLKQLQPVLEEGWKPVVYGSLDVFDFISFIFVVIFLGPYLSKPQGVFKANLAVVFFLLIVLIVQGIYIVGILGPGLFTVTNFPVMEVYKYIDLAGVINNLVAPTIAIWLLTIIIKLSFITWLFAELTKKAFKLKESKILTFPFALLTIALSLAMFPNIITLFIFDARIFTLFAITIQFILPLMLVPFLKGSGN